MIEVLYKKIGHISIKRSWHVTKERWEPGESNGQKNSKEGDRLSTVKFTILILKLVGQKFKGQFPDCKKHENENYKPIISKISNNNLWT